MGEESIPVDVQPQVALRKKRSSNRLLKSSGPNGESHVQAGPNIDRDELAAALFAAVAAGAINGSGGGKRSGIADLYRRLYNRPNMGVDRAKIFASRELRRLRQDDGMDRALERIGVTADVIAEKLHEHLEAWKLDTLQIGEDSMTIPVPNYKAQGAALQMLIDVMGLNKPKISANFSGPLAGWSDEKLENAALALDGRGDADVRYGQGAVIQDGQGPVAQNLAEGGASSVGTGQAAIGEPAQVDSAS